MKNHDGNSFFKILLLFFTTIFVFFLTFSVIEICHYSLMKWDTHWHDPNTRFDEELGWAPIPNRQSQNIRSNSLGFRGEEIRPDISKIFLLGDSVAWGFGVKDDETISAYLNSAMGHFKFQAVNMGVSGYGFDQYYLFLMRHISLLKKGDCLILVVCSNDLADVACNHAYGKRKPFFVLADSGDLQLTGVPIKKFCMKNLLSVSFFPNILYNLTPGKKIMGSMIGDKCHDENQAITISCLLIEKISQACHLQGAYFGVVLTGRQHSDVNPGLQPIKKYLESSGCRYIDFSAAADQKMALEQIYHGPDHLTPLGNKLLAQRILDFTMTLRKT